MSLSGHSNHQSHKNIHNYQLDDYRLENALIEAVVRNDYDKVASLLDQGANPSFNRGYFYSSPLALAILNDNHDIVKLLLDKGANVADSDALGNTYLHLA